MNLSTRNEMQNFINLKHAVIVKETANTCNKKTNENKMKLKKKTKSIPSVKRNLRSSAVQHLKELTPSKSDVGESSTSTPLREIKNVLAIATTIFTQATKTTPSLVLTDSGLRTNLVAVKKTNVLTTPIMATGIQPVFERTATLSRLGPGTLILPDGRLVSVPAPPPAQIIVMPRIVTADTTNTTFVNKVPIPAISSYSQAKPKALVSNLLKRKRPKSDSVVNSRPKIMLFSRENETDKRSCMKVVNQIPPKQKIIKLSHKKNTKPQKTSDTTADRVEKKGSLTIRNNTNDNALEKTNVSDKNSPLVSVDDERSICENNMEIDIPNFKTKKIIESRPSGNEIPLPTTVANKDDLSSNIHVSCEKTQIENNPEISGNVPLHTTLNENGLSEELKILPPARKTIDQMSTAIVSNHSVPETSENYHSTYTIGESQKDNQDIDDTHNLLSIDKETEISNSQSTKLPLPDFSTDMSSNLDTQQSLINNEVASNKSFSTPLLNSRGKNIGEQETLTTNSLTKNAIENEQESQIHKTDLARCSDPMIESQNNIVIDATPKPTNQVNPENITHISPNEKQPTNTRNKDIDQEVTDVRKLNEYCPQEQRPPKLIEKNIPSIHELDQMNLSQKPTTKKLPAISKSSPNIPVNQLESTVVSSSHNTSKKPDPSEYSINSENMQQVNVNSSGMISMQTSATSLNSLENTPLSSSKYTQVNSLDGTCRVSSMENKSSQSSGLTISTETKKSSSGTAQSKISNENKSVMTDVSNELTNLFPSEAKLSACSENIFKDTDRSLFMPISHSYMDELRLSLPHADFSNDIFSSLHVPTGGQHPESISPTAAFLLAFPLVSTSKASELITDNEVTESHNATPTTILQIGNIEGTSNELYNQTSIMIDNNLSNIQESLKLNRTLDSVKNCNDHKQQKDFDTNFSKLHHVEVNEFVRNDHYSKNNFKEKKHFSGVSEHDLFMPCNKKKASGKNVEYALSTDVSNTFQEKYFEFGSNNARNNLIQNSSQVETRQGGSSNNPKKDQVPLQTVVNHQQTYASSQSYSYHTFPSGNDCSMPNSNYLATSKFESGSLKPPQTLPSYQATPWSTATITATSNSASYLAPYCSHQQKSCSNIPSKNLHPKTLQNSCEDQRLKEKGALCGNMLPKFSTNFQFNANNQSIQDIHSYPQTNLTDPNYKTDSKPKKQKAMSQRAPVNWMTTPDIRSVMPDINSAPLLSDVIFQPQKDLDFNPGANSGMLGSSSTVVQSPSLPSNNQSLYNTNTHFSGVDLQLDFSSMPDVTSSKPSKSFNSVPNNQQNPHYSWSPSKSSIPLLPHIESHMIPSTLPTLIGDLALGTNTPSGPLDNNCKTLALPSTPFTLEQPNQQNKKIEMKPDTQKQIIRKSSDKECFSERRNINNRNIQEYCQKTHAHQSTNTTSSFLSVSQLVDHTKSDQNSTRRPSKQSASKSNANLSKRNINAQQQEKPNSSKMNMVSNSNNYHPANRTLLNPRKPDFPVYQENPGVGFLGHPPPYKGGSYSAESLIGDHGVAPPQDQISEMPPFSAGNQFANHFSHNQKPIVPSSSSDYSQQNLQPLEFHQSQHTQNCFNYNTHYPGSSYNPDNDYHLGIDHFYNFNPSSSTPRNSTTCHTSSHTNRDNRSLAHKRMKRREEPQFKCPPNHSVTTTLANFNLSTIFPEINDKRSVQGTNTFLPSANKPNEGSLTRPGGNPALAPQVGMPPHFPPVNFRP